MGQNVTYWAEQVRELVTDDVGVRADHDKNEVRVRLPSCDNTAEERAKLIRSFERSGCDVLSTTNESHIRVDATTDPLDYPYSDTNYSQK